MLASPFVLSTLVPSNNTQTDVHVCTSSFLIITVPVSGEREVKLSSLWGLVVKVNEADGSVWDKSKSSFEEVESICNF